VENRSASLWTFATEPDFGQGSVVVGANAGLLSLGVADAPAGTINAAANAFGPGDAYLIAPGHDAWVLGEEPFVGIEFSSAAEFAKQ
jgi:hypothetical protein